MRPLLVLLLSWLSASVLAGSVNPVDLRCEYNVHPLGIDSASPRLFWKLDGGDRGARQTAYHVLAASSEELLRRGQGDLWDSGKVKSSQATFLSYPGKPLGARRKRQTTQQVVGRGHHHCAARNPAQMASPPGRQQMGFLPLYPTTGVNRSQAASR
jgi:hypothetical protein